MSLTRIKLPASSSTWQGLLQARWSEDEGIYSAHWQAWDLTCTLPCFPHSEEEPHAARSELPPVPENQQLRRGPGPGRGDAAGPHHPCVTVSVHSHQGRLVLPALANLGPLGPALGRESRASPSRLGAQPPCLDSASHCMPEEIAFRSHDPL